MCGETAALENAAGSFSLRAWMFWRAAKFLCPAFADVRWTQTRDEYLFQLCRRDTESANDIAGYRTKHFYHSNHSRPKEKNKWFLCHTSFVFLAAFHRYRMGRALIR